MCERHVNDTAREMIPHVRKPGNGINQWFNMCITFRYKCKTWAKIKTYDKSSGNVELEKLREQVSGKVSE